MDNIATWLDLALVSARPERARTVRIHDVGSGARRNCFALSVENRWLHAGGGELTVFHGMSTVLHFLKLAGVRAFEPGLPRRESVSCGGGACLCLDGRRKLEKCARAAGG